MINNKHIFLIVRTSLERPVEASSQDKYIVNDHKLIVHVILRCAISSAINPNISHSMDIWAWVVHTFVVRDNLYMDSCFVTSYNCIRQIVICKVENTNLEIVLRHINVSNNFLNVFFIWEKESVDESRIWSVKIYLDLMNKFTKILKNCLWIAIL